MLLHQHLCSSLLPSGDDRWCLTCLVDAQSDVYSMLCRPTEVALEASPSELAISDHKGTTDSHNLQTLQTVRQLRHSTSAQEVSNSNHSGFRPSCVEALGGLKASDAHRGPWPSWPSKAANKPPAAAASQAAAVLPAEASSPIRQGSSSVCSEVDTSAACQHCLCNMSVMHFVADVTCLMSHML